MVGFSNLFLCGFPEDLDVLRLHCGMMDIEGEVKVSDELVGLGSQKDGEMRYLLRGTALLDSFDLLITLRGREC